MYNYISIWNFPHVKLHFNTKADKSADIRLSRPACKENSDSGTAIILNAKVQHCE